MLVSLFGEIQVFLLLSIIFVGFLYWINRKYKSFNKQIIKAIDIPVYLISKQGIVLKLLNEPTEKTNLLPLNNLGKLDLRNLVIDTYSTITESFGNTRFCQSNCKNKSGERKGVICFSTNGVLKPRTRYRFCA